MTDTDTVRCPVCSAQTWPWHSLTGAPCQSCVTRLLIVWRPTPEQIQRLRPSEYEEVRAA